MSAGALRPSTPAATLPVATPPRAPVSLAIERIVLDGVALDGSGRRQLERALRRELETLIAARGGVLPQQSGALPSLAAPLLTAPQGRPGELGRALARSVFAALESLE